LNDSPLRVSLNEHAMDQSEILTSQRERTRRADSAVRERHLRIITNKKNFAVWRYLIGAFRSRA
jgi:hypothetical protein